MAAGMAEEVLDADRAGRDRPSEPVVEIAPLDLSPSAQQPTPCGAADGEGCAPAADRARLHLRMITQNSCNPFAKSLKILSTMTLPEVRGRSDRRHSALHSLRCLYCIARIIGQNDSRTAAIVTMALVHTKMFMKCADTRLQTGRRLPYLRSRSRYCSSEVGGLIAMPG